MNRNILAHILTAVFFALWILVTKWLTFSLASREIIIIENFSTYVIVGIAIPITISALIATVCLIAYIWLSLVEFFEDLLEGNDD